jgi:SAM-dependent methyltransferase
MQPLESWGSGEAYEAYVGRWSRVVAAEFLPWVSVPGNRQWLDVGCGTGELSRAILAACTPASVIGIDRSEAYVQYARAHTNDACADFRVGDAQELPLPDESVDAAVSALVLNFVASPEKAAAEMCRVTRSGGVVGLYLWDYAEGMQFMRYFWDAVGDLDASARELDEGPRFPVCKPDALRQLLHGAGLREIDVRGIVIPTHFRDFHDFWNPFLGGQGPGPGYVQKLGAEAREALRERLRSKLPTGADGSIRLTARAWAARGSP